MNFSIALYFSSVAFRSFENERKATEEK